MPNRLEVTESILNQMLKGPSGTFPEITDGQKEEFYARFGELANKIALVLPQISSGTYSGAIGAVICKCAIKYGLDKALNLVDSVRNCMFQGKSDPARLLWTFMKSKKVSRGIPSTQIYRKTVTAARAYCENRFLNDSDLRAANRDIFEWNSDFSAPKSQGEWWEKIKPSYSHGGTFRVFSRQTADNKREWIIVRRDETIALCDDGKIEVKRIKVCEIKHKHTNRASHIFKIRDGEVDFAVRRGRKGPVIYALTTSSMLALKQHAPPLPESVVDYEWRQVGKQEALVTTWASFRRVVTKLQAENFNIISPHHP